MVQKSWFLAISGDGGNWRGLAFHKKWPEDRWFCQNRPYRGRVKPHVRKQTNRTKLRNNKLQAHNISIKLINIDRLRRLDSEGLDGSDLPHQCSWNSGTSLVKAMLWWRGVWWDRPKTIGRLGDIGFFTL